MVIQNEYAQSVELTCKLSGESWILTNVYAPCTDDGKASFLNWFKRISVPLDVKWLIVEDFNLTRSLENRNKSGNVHHMFAFNEAISNLRLVEIPLRGCKYTWTKKQQNPLLERLDWFFTSNAWTTAFPNTYASALSRDTSDHTPCVIIAATKVPWPQIFRLQNYSLQHDQFMAILQHGWNLPLSSMDGAKVISAKIKNLRRVLKAWKAQLHNLTSIIVNLRKII
jgi:hypothetical protein